MSPLILSFNFCLNILLVTSLCKSGRAERRATARPITPILSVSDPIVITKK